MVTRRRPARKKRSRRPLGNFGGAPRRQARGWVVLVLAALVVVNLYVFVWDKQTSVGAIKREADRATPSAMVPARPLAEPGPGSGSPGSSGTGSGMGSGAAAAAPAP